SPYGERSKRRLSCCKPPSRRNFAALEQCLGAAKHFFDFILSESAHCKTNFRTAARGRFTDFQAFDETETALRSQCGQDALARFDECFHTIARNGDRHRLLDRAACTRTCGAYHVRQR